MLERAPLKLTFVTLVFVLLNHFFLKSVNSLIAKVILLFKQFQFLFNFKKASREKNTKTNIVYMPKQL